MPSFSAWQLNNVTTSGTPFGSNALADSDDIGTTITINPGARPKKLNMTDNDANFEDADSGQQLDGAHSFNGNNYPDNASIETEYAYTVRPAGGNPDGSDDIRIYAVEISAHVEGFVADGFMQPGVTYTIVSIYDQSPVVSYSSLYVCFRAGTMIRTRDGLCGAETLRPNDMLWTADAGYQPLIWVGAREVSGLGAMAPIRFDKGVLGNTRPLFVSPQHRMVVKAGLREVMIPSLAFKNLPGIAQMPLPHVHYVHLLLAKHHVLQANGALSESLNPGPMAWATFNRDERRQMANMGLTVSKQRSYPDARPIMTVRQGKNFAKIAVERAFAQAKTQIPNAV